MAVEDRKQVLYLRMHNVSIFLSSQTAHVRKFPNQYVIPRPYRTRNGEFALVN